MWPTQPNNAVCVRAHDRARVCACYPCCSLPPPPLFLSRDICSRNSCPSKIPKLPPINPALPLSDPSVCVRSVHTWAISTQGELVGLNTPTLKGLSRTLAPLGPVGGQLDLFLPLMTSMITMSQSRAEITVAARQSHLPVSDERNQKGQEDGDGGYYFCYAGSSRSCGFSVAPSGLSYYSETVAPKWLPLQRRCERINGLALLRGLAHLWAGERTDKVTKKTNGGNRS